MDAPYLNLIEMACERSRTGGWTLVDVYDFSRKLQNRFERLYGRPLSL